MVEDAQLTEVAATMAVSSRGTDIGRIGALLNEVTVVGMVKEFGKGAKDRQAITIMNLDGTMATVLDPDTFSRHVKKTGRSVESSKIVAMSTQCCTPVGGYLVGKCCRYDWQEMLECCGPCAFTAKSWAFLPCVLAWCSYCYYAKCIEFWHICR